MARWQSCSSSPAARRGRLAASALAALTLLWQPPAPAADGIAVIVAADSVPIKLNRRLLRDLYLKKLLIDAHGQTFVPVNLPPENPLRRSLTGTLFSRNAQQLQDYWNQQYFQGVSPPYVLRSEEAVLQFVAETRGAIGYVAACHLDRRVQAVMILPVAPAERSALAQLCAVPAAGAD